MSDLRHIVRKSLLQKHNIVIASLKGSVLTNFKKQISKRAACLLQYIRVVHEICQQFILIKEYLTFLLLVSFQKLGAFIHGYAVCPVKFGFKIGAQIIQVLGRVEEVGLVSLLALR